MSDENLYKRAEKKADEKIRFYKHLRRFIIVNVVLIILNFVTLDKGGGHWWFYWITLFWGIILLVHFLKIFVLKDNFDDKRDEMIQNEMEKIKK